ncbi:odorant receptor 13a-like [Vespula squamosa]|uniref:Odorant receptor 13a-like n=1 Tax=Vespula squamosa TaxID=30214 RepID=A0ABD2BH99_VESSQ
MNSVSNRITTKIMKEIGTRLRRRKENLSERLFFNGKTIKGSFQDSTIDQPLEYYGQARGYDERNLNVIKEIQSFVYKNSLPEPVTLTVSAPRRVFTKKLSIRLHLELKDCSSESKTGFFEAKKMKQLAYCLQKWFREN